MNRRAKSILLAFLGSVAVLAIAACADSSPDPLALDAGANGGSAELSVDQTLEISLEGNPTTGYSWEIKEAGSPVVRSEGEPVYVEGPTDGTVVGAGGTYTFKFVAAETGESTIELIYHRAWETAEPLDTFTLKVLVE